MDSATKNAHMTNITRFNLLLSFLFFLLLLPFSFAFPIPLPFVSFHSLRFCHPRVRIIEEYTPLIAFCHVLSDWSQIFSVLLHWCPCPFSSFPFPSYFPPSFPFVLLFSFLFLPFPFSFPFPFPFSFPFLFLPFFFTLWFSFLALRAFDSFPPPLVEAIIEEYTPLKIQKLDLRILIYKGWEWRLIITDESLDW